VRSPILGDSTWCVPTRTARIRPWLALRGADVRASLAHALFTDIGMRRGPGALWRHAPRVLRALERALKAEVHYGP